MKILGKVLLLISLIATAIAFVGCQNSASPEAKSNDESNNTTVSYLDEDGSVRALYNKMIAEDGNLAISVTETENGFALTGSANEILALSEQALATVEEEENSDVTRGRKKWRYASWNFSHSPASYIPLTRYCRYECFHTRTKFAAGVAAAAITTRLAVRYGSCSYNGMRDGRGPRNGYFKIENGNYIKVSMP